VETGSEGTGIGRHRSFGPFGQFSRRFRLLGVLLAYLLPSLLLFRQVVAAPGTRLPGGNDGTLFSWWLGWVPHALATGANPLVTNYLNAPDGVNGMWTTSVPLLGILGAPLTAVAGPVVTMNVLFVLAPALSAWVCCAVVLRWVRLLPAAVAGLLYGFSPFVLGASRGHVHLSLAVFPPLVLGLLDDLLRGRRSSRRTGLWLGLAAGAQFYVSGEVLASTALVAGLGLALLAALHRHRVRELLPTVGQGLGVAALVMIVVSLPGLLVQFTGPHRVRGAVQRPDVAVTDLLGFVVPGFGQALRTAGNLATFRSFTGPGVELGGYLGLPMVVLALVLLVRYRREALPRFCVLLALLVAVASLGPHLHVRGRNTGVILPWRLMQNLPVTEQILPSRLSEFVLLLLAVALAWWLDRCLRAGVAARLLSLGVTGLVLAFLWPVPTAPSAVLATPRFFTSSAVHVLPAGAPVLVVPYPWSGQAGAMTWQARSGYRFRLVGGYFTGEEQDGHRLFNAPPEALNLTLIALVQGKVGPADVSARLPAARAELARLGVRAVVLGPCAHRGAVRAALIELLGRPPAPVADVEIWVAPPGGPLVSPLSPVE
jgi:hypothetical protein